ncbi:MAG: putative peptide-modifying radical SAM/SPASM domain-containing protein, partial [Candidatus Hecatellales archaeon]
MEFQHGSLKANHGWAISMLYFVFTTGACNLNCRYCGGSFPERLVPWTVRYRLSELSKFLEGDKGEIIVAFYGGEPLLNPKFIKEVMEKVSADRFVIQTNGTLIKKLERKFWLKFDSVLLSIDGRREITDHYRGPGVYDRVVRAARWLRKIGFSGDLIARMTVSERSEIFSDVSHLVSLKLFDHIHWQLNVIWTNSWRDFDGWSRASYKPGISKLIELWTSCLERGEVMGLVPFLGIVKSMIDSPISSPPCEAGRRAFAILTNGKILACPIAVDAKWAYLGDIRSKSPD